MTDNTPAIQQLNVSTPARYCGPNTFGELVQTAQRLFASNLLPKTIRSVEAAVAVIQTGRELQLNPMEAFRNVHVIEGTPTVSPKCKLGLIQRSGELADLRIVEGEGWAECTMRRKGQPSPITVRFTMEEAQRAGLTNKGNWKAWPRNMMRWRAIGFVADMLFSDVTGGHFTPDELGAETDAEGEPVEVEQAPEPQRVERGQQVQTMTRVHEAWQAALHSGWTDAELAAFFRERGANRKSEITPAHLDELLEAVESRSNVVDATVVDWANDPAVKEA